MSVVRTVLVACGLLTAGLVADVALVPPTPALAQIGGEAPLPPGAGQSHPFGQARLDPDRCAKTAAAGGSGLGGNGQVGNGAGGGGGGSWGGGAPAATTTTKPDDKEHGLCSTLMGEMIPGANPGQYPTENYDLGYDRGGALSVDRKVIGFLMSSTFSGVHWVVRLGLWVTNWSLGFEFARRLADPASAVAGRYQSRVVGPMHLEELFLTVAAAYAGWLALSGRMVRGLTEFGVSILLSALAAGLWANPGTYLVNALKFTTGLSYEIAAVTTNDDNAPTSTDAVGRPMLAAIHKAFVETPHEILNWGRVIPAGDKCRAVYEAAVRSGPWGSADEPRDAMKDEGCTTEANFNHDPSASRLFGALVVLVAAVFALALLVMVALTLIAAQLSVVVAIALAPVALVFGALPGRGRALFWRWVAGIGVALSGVVMMAVLLSLTLSGIAGLLTATAGESILVQLFVLDVVVVIALRKRASLLDSGRRAASGFAQHMGGGQAPRRSWYRAGEAGVAGFGLGSAMNRTTATLRHHGNRSRQRELLGATQERGEAERTYREESLEQATIHNEHLREVTDILHDASINGWP